MNRIATRTRRRLAAAAAAVAATFSLTGCTGVFSTGLYDVPLPGGADLGDHPYEVTVQFSDVLDLVPQSAVKVGNVPVGRVTKIALGPDGRTAVVTVQVNGDVSLPGNAIASIQQTSLLGEKYVDLARPVDDVASGTLHGGDVIPVSRTSEGVQVEQVFGALSLLLNGGGLEQIQTITGELNKATDGRDADFRNLLERLDATVTQLDARKTSITRALDSVNLLATNLRLDSTQIAAVLDDIAPGLKVLAKQRGQFVGLLDSLNRLSTVSVDTLDASQDDIVADLNQLAPILGQLAAAGSAFPQSLQVLLTYPFPDTVLQAIKGDYFSGFIVLNLNTTQSDIDAVSDPATAPGASSGGLPTSPDATTLGTTPVDPPPSLLPSTSSASPGLPSSTVVTTSPTASASGSASGSPSGSASGTPSGSGSSTPAGSPSGNPSGSTSESAPPTASTRGGGS
ncbi:MCE family protein [Jatrophihabitans sp. YIM 134969]